MNFEYTHYSYNPPVIPPPSAVQSNIPYTDMKYNSIQESFVIGDDKNPMHEPVNSVKQTQKTHH